MPHDVVSSFEKAMDKLFKEVIYQTLDEFENQTRAETLLIKDQRRRERREEGKEREGGERAAFCGILDRI